MITRLKEVQGDESGFTTAELLGNAALGVAGAAAIWVMIKGAGPDIVQYITDTMKGK